MYQEIKNQFSDVPELKLKDLDARLKKGDLVFLDVRAEAERRVSIIPGALSVQEFEKQSLDSHKTVVVYCTIGYRSAKVVRKLKKKGIRAYNLEGSLLGWIHDGRPVVGPHGQNTKEVHVYGKSWNFLPQGFKGVW
ncbi:MAG: rhodanese-like domain-containing protein [Pseudomonadota bacterium]